MRSICWRALSRESAGPRCRSSREHLRYLVAVADERQLTRAAAKLNISRPALSHAVSQLESEVGFQLLERQARGVALTPAGEVFLERARLALDAAEEASLAAQSLARAAQGQIEFGFVGAPPGLDSPGPLARFTQEHPDIDISYHELPFPGRSSTRWLAEVDIAVTHLPPPDENVWTQLVRVEPRAVLAPKGHPLAKRDSVTVADVLDEAFIGYHPDVDPEWAGFWSLDEHRGGPPRELTPDHAANPQEVLAALAVRGAITTVPSSSAALLLNVLTGIAAVPLEDASPAAFVLAGRRDRPHPLVEEFVAFARPRTPTGS